MRAKRDAQRRAEAIKNRLQPRLQCTLAHARSAQLHVSFLLREQAARGEPRHDLLNKHRLQLVRRAGQHHKDLSILLDPKTGSGAVGVHEYFAALEDECLLEIIGRHRAPEPRETRHDARLDAHVVDQFLPEDFGEAFARAVVTRRPETARRDHDIGPRPALAKLRDDRVGVVGDRDVAAQGHAAPAQLRADEREVAVGRQPE